MINVQEDARNNKSVESGLIDIKYNISFTDIGPPKA